MGDLTIDKAYDVTDEVRERLLIAGISVSHPMKVVLANSFIAANGNIMMCPQCLWFLPLIEHDGEQRCPQCQLYMKRLGNTLFLMPASAKDPWRNFVDHALAIETYEQLQYASRDEWRGG